MQEENETNVTFSGRLRQLMRQRGLNSNQLAKAIGVSRPAIGNYLSGRIPELAQLKAIADFFKVSDDWLLGRKSETTVTSGAEFKDQASHSSWLDEDCGSLERRSSKLAAALPAAISQGAKRELIDDLLALANELKSRYELNLPKKEIYGPKTHA